MGEASVLECGTFSDKSQFIRLAMFIKKACDQTEPQTLYIQNLKVAIMIARFLCAKRHLHGLREGGAMNESCLVLQRCWVDMGWVSMRFFHADLGRPVGP